MTKKQSLIRAAFGSLLIGAGLAMMLSAKKGCVDCGEKVDAVVEVAEEGPWVGEKATVEEEITE